MKRIMFYSTVLALVLGSLSFLVSCDNKKDQFADYDGIGLNYEFSVADQQNVDRFEIIVSTTGNVNEQWTAAGMLLPIEQGLIHDYTLKVDITDWLKNYSVIYTRIKTVDKDGKLTYSPVQTTYRD